MGKQFIYFLGGGLFVYYVLMNKKKIQSPKNTENTENTETTSQIVGVSDVIKNSRNFEFKHKNEEVSFGKTYDKQYSNNQTPIVGDLLVSSWCMPNSTFCTRSTYQYFDRYWRRMPNVLQKNIKMFPDKIQISSNLVV